MGTVARWAVAFTFAASFAYMAQAQEINIAGRTEIKRNALTGTSMEIIVSTSETKPGETLPRHIHHGEESFYVIEGATIELPDGRQTALATGASSINVRDIPHGGFKVVGDKTLKLFLVHIVDKGSALYDTPPPPK